MPKPSTTCLLASWTPQETDLNPHFCVGFQLLTAKRRRSWSTALSPFPPGTTSPPTEQPSSTTASTPTTTWPPTALVSSGAGPHPHGTVWVGVWPCVCAFASRGSLGWPLWDALQAAGCGCSLHTLYPASARPGLSDWPHPAPQRGRTELALPGALSMYFAASAEQRGCSPEFCLLALPSAPCSTCNFLCLSERSCCWREQQVQQPQKGLHKAPHPSTQKSRVAKAEQTAAEQIMVDWVSTSSPWSTTTETPQGALPSTTGLYTLWTQL